jgi:hypothetical protein
LQLAVSHICVYAQIIISVRWKFGFVIIRLARSSIEQRLWRVIDGREAPGRGGGVVLRSEISACQAQFVLMARGPVGPSDVTVITGTRRKDVLNPVPSSRRNRF